MTSVDRFTPTFWKDYFDRQHGEQARSDAKKLDYSNDRVRYQTYGWLIEATGPVMGLACLDAGCGTGDVALLLACLGGRVDAFDFAEPAIADLQRRHFGVRWFVGDLATLGRSDIRGPYDVVVASEVLQYVDPAAGIAALWRYVGPGGRLIAVLPNAECPFVQSARVRFEDRYVGISAPDLAASVAALDEVGSFRWRGARFLADQTLMPYEMGPWSGEARQGDGVPPNRLQLAVTRRR